MSWSDNRTKTEVTINKEKILEKIKNVNAVLEKLAKDLDFQDDLKTPDVKCALDHWTGKNRLHPEEALKLQDNRRCIYVLQRLQMLQHVCHDAHIAVPFDLMITGKDKLPESFINSTFGELLNKASSATELKKPESNDNTKELKISADPTTNTNNNKVSATNNNKKEASPKPSSSSEQVVTEEKKSVTNNGEQQTTTATSEKKQSPAASNSLLMLAASILVVIVSIVIVYISTQRNKQQ